MAIITKTTACALGASRAGLVVAGTIRVGVYDAAGTELIAPDIAGITERGTSGYYYDTIPNFNTTWSGEIRWTLADGTFLIGDTFDASAPTLAEIVAGIWSALTSTLTTVGSIGKRISDFLTGDAFVRLGAPAGASVSADIAAIKAKTDNLPSDPADASVIAGLIAAIPQGLTAGQDARLSHIEAAAGLDTTRPSTQVTVRNVTTETLPIPGGGNVVRTITKTGRDASTSTVIEEE